jgi:hypothetical protein
MRAGRGPERSSSTACPMGKSSGRGDPISRTALLGCSRMDPSLTGQGSCTTATTHRAAILNRSISSRGRPRTTCGTWLPRGEVEHEAVVRPPLLPLMYWRFAGELRLGSPRHNSPVSFIAARHGSVSWSEGSTGPTHDPLRYFEANLVAEGWRLHGETPHPEDDEEVGQLTRDADRDVEHGRSL